jgi:predicted DNA-binding transcriptional regulator AlpA
VISHLARRYGYRSRSPDGAAIYTAGDLNAHSLEVRDRHVESMMRRAQHRKSLGPLLTLSEEDLVRPARRREDRDVLVLRIEIEAQRREVARLMELVAGGVPVMDLSVAPATATMEPDRVLLSARDLKRALGVSPGTLYKWIQDGAFPPQIHIGRLARWQKADVDTWLRDRAADRRHDAVGRQRGQTIQRVRGGRSRWTTSTSPEPTITEGYVPDWEPRPTPLRGVGWRPTPGEPQPVPPDHADYTVPRFRISDAARYVGLPWHRKGDLLEIPHGRTTGMHHCFAQSDLDEFKSTMPARTGKRQKPSGKVEGQ